MKPIQAIDVHGHYGLYHRDESPALVNQFMTGDAELVARRARESNVEYTVVSPLLGLLPRGKADAVAGNREAARIVPKTKGLLQWVIVHPLQKQTFEQAREMMKSPTCVGIKLHPEEHVYPIRKHGRALFQLAAELRAVVLVHSGEAYSEPVDFVKFANDFPEVKLILAHLGNAGAKRGDVDLQVRALQTAKHGNVWIDTSSARSVFPGLIEWAVKEVGADRLLFGTDTPLYFTANQRARIDYADITTKQKRMILRDNAAKLLKLGL